MLFRNQYGFPIIPNNEGDQEVYGNVDFTRDEKFIKFLMTGPKNRPEILREIFNVTERSSPMNVDVADSALKHLLRKLRKENNGIMYEGRKYSLYHISPSLELRMRKSQRLRIFFKSAMEAWQESRMEKA